MHRFVKCQAGDLIVRIHDSPWFRIFIMAAIVLDAVVRATHSYKFLREYLHELFVFETALLTGIYTLEFLIKVWAEGFRYLKSKSGVFDALVLGAVYLSAFRPDEAAPLTVELRAARLLKIISFIPKSLYAFFLLLVFVFFFGVCGFYCFGGPDSPDPLHWEDKSSSFFSVAVFVTLDGWNRHPGRAGQRGDEIEPHLHHPLHRARLLHPVQFVHCGDERVHDGHHEKTCTSRCRASCAFLLEDCSLFCVSFAHTHKVREEPCSSVNFAKLYLTAQRHLDHKTQEMSRCYDEMAEVLQELKEDEQLHEP
uniref:Ion transport domain-containing protein n=1 Tax=Myripristis murdjan TaxID=586833 RepID=A0A667XZI3_9TELE